MFYRKHLCGCCGLEWMTVIERAASTPNISGEKTPYCPKCYKRAMSSSEPLPACPTCEQPLPYKRLTNGSEVLDIDQLKLAEGGHYVHRECPIVF